MLKVVQDASDANGNGIAALGASLLDEIVRDGARQMLAAALQAEIAAFTESCGHEVDEDGHRLLVRNGYHAEREVTTAAGAVKVRQPRVNDKRADETMGERKRFASSILPAASSASRRKCRRYCRCCIDMGCPPVISPRRSNSSSDPGRACRHR